MYIVWLYWKVQNSYHQIHRMAECCQNLSTPFFYTKSFYPEKVREEVVRAEPRQPDRGEVEEVTDMADLPLYLTNANVSLGQTMETDKVGLCEATFATFRVCER